MIALITTFFANIRHIHAEAAAIQHLRRLSDRELEDIGVIRGDIELAVQTGARSA